MTATIDLTTQTPAEIDTALAEVWGRYDNSERRVRQITNDLKRGHRRLELSPHAAWLVADLERGEKILAEAREKAEALKEEMAPFEAEFTRRGGWTRAWKVANIQGHVHRSMRCRTCHLTTSFVWLPQVSGLPEAEIVDLAGEAACSECYPNIPAATRVQPSRLLTAAEQDAAAKRERRIQAKIERQRQHLERISLRRMSTVKVW